MIKPKITIILPVFNGEKYLGRAIESCLGQSYKNIELIIVEDHSTDNSIEIAKNYLAIDSRVKLICNAKNLKLPACLNLGHKESTGDYITWTSHDNYFHADAIEIMYETHNTNNVDVVYSDYLTIDENDKLSGFTKLKDIEYSLFYGVIGACFLYTRDFHLKNGNYDEDLFLLEDFDYWLRGLKHGKFLKINNPGLYYYRYHLNSLTSQINRDINYKENFHLGRVKCYSKILDFKASVNKDSNNLIDYFTYYGTGDICKDMVPIQNLSFFRNLKTTLLDFQGINYAKIKRIIVNDCVEILLKNKEYQKLKVLINLHKVAWPELLRLPIERYFAIIKKCLL